MVRIVCSFVEAMPSDPIGFELGNIEFRGPSSVVTSASKTPNQSMMLILSIVELLDGTRRFLSTPKLDEYRFTGVDSSFTVVFRKVSNNQIAIDGSMGQIDVVAPSQLKTEIENSVLEFAHKNDLEKWMSVAETDDFRNSLKRFQSF